MKIDKYEIGIAGVILFFVTLLFLNLYLIDKKIEENGGIKNVIIKTGREIKDIVNEINIDTTKVINDTTKVQ